MNVEEDIELERSVTPKDSDGSGGKKTINTEVKNNTPKFNSYSERENNQGKAKTNNFNKRRRTDFDPSACYTCGRMRHFALSCLVVTQQTGAYVTCYYSG